MTQTFENNTCQSEKKKCVLINIDKAGFKDFFSFSNIFDLNRKTLLCFKRKQEKLVDSEFVKTCHEHVNQRLIVVL